MLHPAMRASVGVRSLGSAAGAGEDQWSDVDLAFGVQEGTDVAAVLSEWTARMCEQHGAVHYTDTRFGEWIHRSFLLANTLQVDLAFAPASEFRSLGPTFRLMFGDANEPR